MTRDDLRRAVVEALRRVAPESDPGALAGDADLREALDLDSMDFLNVVVALHEALGVDVAEAEYPRFATLDGAVDALAGKLGVAPEAPRA